MKKEIIIIGLGRMGAAMAANLAEHDYSVYGFDTDEVVRKAANEIPGITVFETLQETIAAFTASKKTLWLMVPSRYVDDVIDKLRPHLNNGDTIIDGGNSFFKDSIRRHNDLEDGGIEFIDCGTSGGVDGARHGASLMIGGRKEAFKKHEELFETLATKDGYGHVGEAGAGHFVKMVHNGIEYGMMGAIAEGVNVLHEHKDGLNIDILEALKPFEHGSIIESNLITWLVDSYKVEGYLDHIAGKVPIGETEMEMEYLIEHEEVKILDAAVQQRKHTRVEPSFIGTLISAMRNQFGGHKVIVRTDSSTNSSHENKHN